MKKYTDRELREAKRLERALLSRDRVGRAMAFCVCALEVAGILPDGPSDVVQRALIRGVDGVELDRLVAVQHHRLVHWVESQKSHKSPAIMQFLRRKARSYYG